MILASRSRAAASHIRIATALAGLFEFSVIFSGRFSALFSPRHLGNIRPCGGLESLGDPQTLSIEAVKEIYKKVLLHMPHFQQVLNADWWWQHTIAARGLKNLAQC
jgi:hypothetical protein